MSALTKHIVSVNLAWFYTAFSMAFRVIEIPFVIYFITQSVQYQNQLSIFGWVLSCLMLGSGVLTALTTITVQGNSNRNIAKLGCIAFIIAFIVYMCVYLLLKNTSQILMLYGDIWKIHILSLCGLLFVAIRRVLVGKLLSQSHTHIILVSSFVRIGVSILLSVFLSVTLSNALYGFAILVFGAFVEVCILLVYFMYSNHIHTKNLKSSHDTSIFNYLKFSSAHIIYMCQGYVILWFLSIYTPSAPVALWVVIFSFISLFTGVFTEIANIVLRYQIRPKNSVILFMFPLVLCQLMVYIFLYTNWGNSLYFVTFQNIADADIPILHSLRISIVIVVCIFLIKEICKGFCLIHKKYSVIMTNSILNISGLFIISTGILLFAGNTYHNAFVGTLIYMCGVCIECVAYVYISYILHKNILPK